MLLTKDRHILLDHLCDREKTNTYQAAVCIIILPPESWLAFGCLKRQFGTAFQAGTNDVRRGRGAETATQCFAIGKGLRED